jgi:uncharacterized membrane protein YeaQ/YmgE (transglycosylase-associated protein family)
MFAKVVMGMLGAIIASDKDHPVVESIGNAALGAVVFLTVRDIIEGK